jgi:RimJ/RimL family protein N-acetyltransferase
MSERNGKSGNVCPTEGNQRRARTEQLHAIDLGRSVRGIALRQVADDDMPFLFQLFADPQRCHLWMRGRRVYDEAGFAQAWAAWTSDEIAAKFLVESGGRPVGLVFDHGRNTEDGWTKATMLLATESVGHGAGVIANGLFMDWLFQALPFRKVYHEVFRYNERVVQMSRKLGLVEEGVLKADRFWNGAYWDLHIFALYREAWYAMRPRVLAERGRIPRQIAAELDGDAVRSRGRQGADHRDGLIENLVDERANVTKE